MEGYINLKTLTFDELVGVVNLYPWFGNARKELCVRLLSMGDMDVASEALSDASMYVSSRRALASLLRQQDKADCSDKDIDAVLRAYITEAGEPEKSDDSRPRQVLVVGGDYFSQEQYDRVRKSDDSIFSGFAGKAADSRRDETAGGAEDMPEFYTETLARIYAEQGYREQARKIYSKLILAYPEKNAYFAALIQKIDQEN